MQFEDIDALHYIAFLQPSRDTASDGGTSLVVGSWDDEKNMVRKQFVPFC